MIGKPARTASRQGRQAGKPASRQAGKDGEGGEPARTARAAKTAGAAIDKPLSSIANLLVSMDQFFVRY
jgi:hypothetical protein